MRKPSQIAAEKARDKRDRARGIIDYKTRINKADKPTFDSDAAKSRAGTLDTQEGDKQIAEADAIIAEIHATGQQ